MNNVMSLLVVRDTTAKGGVTGQRRNIIQFYRDIYTPTKLKCKLVMELV